MYHRLEARAAAAGLPLSEYLRRELERMASQLTPEELRASLDRLEPVTAAESPTEVLRTERDAH